MFESFLFNPFSDFLETQVADAVTTQIMSFDPVSALITAFNKGGILQKISIVSAIANVKLVMGKDVSTESDYTTEAGKTTFFEEHKIAIICGIIVFVLCCVLIYFYGGYVHYLLTWPYHLMCKMVGQTTTTTCVNMVTPHWLFPFLETSVPVETIVSMGPSELVKAVGYFLTAAWTTLVGFVSYVAFSTADSS